MQKFKAFLPSVVVLAAILGMLIYGPIAQLPNYHAFSDHAALFGIPHAGDVLSNLGFALVALWGLIKAYPLREHCLLKDSWPGYALFLLALLLTAFGSGYYHLSPDNDRLLLDRLPIALACAGLLAAVRADLVPGGHAKADSLLLGVFAVASVFWWYVTELKGVGDLRPYLLLQVMPLVLIPLWQWIYRAPKADRIAFGVAIGLYVLAKVAEVHDHGVHGMLGAVSGHTIKHLLATAAAGVIIWRMIQREKSISTTCRQIRTIPASF